MAIYEYRAKCIRVIDGDTVHLEVDLGFRMSCHHHFRLLGIDTPEQYEEFLEIWKDADPGIPEVEDAEERLKRLRVEG